MSIDLLEAIDEICEQFEDCQQAGSPTLLENFIPPTWIGKDREQLIYYLLKIELEYQARRGQIVSVPSLKSRFADVPDVIESVLSTMPVIETPVSVDTFLLRLEESGVLPREAFQEFVSSDRDFSSGQSFAQEMVARRLLTPFQAEEILLGRGQSLVLGNYLLLAKIGSGGMGQVFKAKHQRMDRIVAVKLLPSDISQDATAIQRFSQEVKAAAKLMHPNIVVAYDADEAPDAIHFLVMEYVEGRNLAEMVSAEPAIPVESAVDYILQAARGLDYAHRQGVIHRDVKPSNLLLANDGKIKILDLGLACFQDAARLTIALHFASPADDMIGQNPPSDKDPSCATRSELTKIGDVMGSVDYMAPEQALRSSRVDHRADIYSLGCTLYRLLTKTNLFVAATTAQKLMAHQTEPIPLLRDRRPDVPTSLECIFQKMVAKRTEDRFQTMAEVIEKLESLRSDQAWLPASPPSLASKNSTDAQLQSGASDFPTWWKNRNSLIATGIAAIFATLLGTWIIIKDRNGKQVDRVPIPEGGKAELSEIIDEKPAQAENTDAPWPFDPQDGLTYTWSKPENLGPKVNNAEQQTFLSLSSDQLCLVVQTSEIDSNRNMIIEYRRSHIDDPWTNDGVIIARDSIDGASALSADGLSLLYNSKLMQGNEKASAFDIFLRQRAHRDASWGPPTQLSSNINSPFNEGTPCLSPDGLSLVFNSKRPGGFGANDLYICHRETNDDAWGEAKNLGENVNGPGRQSRARFITNRSHLLYSGSHGLNVAKSDADGNWTVIASFPSMRGFNHVWPSLDGRVLYYGQKIEGGYGKSDIWVTRRVLKNASP